VDFTDLSGRCLSLKKDKTFNISKHLCKIETTPQSPLTVNSVQTLQLFNLLQSIRDNHPQVHAKVKASYIDGKRKGSRDKIVKV
jgi:hypothetical protein